MSQNLFVILGYCWLSRITTCTKRRGPFQLFIIVIVHGSRCCSVVVASHQLSIKSPVLLVTCSLSLSQEILLHRLVSNNDLLNFIVFLLIALIEFFFVQEMLTLPGILVLFSVPNSKFPMSGSLVHEVHRSPSQTCGVQSDLEKNLSQSGQPEMRNASVVDI